MQRTLHFDMHFPKAATFCRNKKIGFCNKSDSIFHLQCATLFQFAHAFKKYGHHNYDNRASKYCNANRGSAIHTTFYTCKPCPPEDGKKCDHVLYGEELVTSSIIST